MCIMSMSMSTLQTVCGIRSICRLGTALYMLCGSQSELQARQNASEAALHGEHISLRPVCREEGRTQTALHVDPHWERLSPGSGRHC